MKRWIRYPDPANANRMTPKALGDRLGEDSVRKKLRRAICNFPSEWEQSTVEARHEWLRGPANPYGLNHDTLIWLCDTLIPNKKGAAPESSPLLVFAL